MVWTHPWKLQKLCYFVRSPDCEYGRSMSRRAFFKPYWHTYSVGISPHYSQAFVAKQRGQLFVWIIITLPVPRYNLFFEKCHLNKENCKKCSLYLKCSDWWFLATAIQAARYSIACIWICILYHLTSFVCNWNASTQERALCFCIGGAGKRKFIRDGTVRRSKKSLVR